LKITFHSDPINNRKGFMAQIRQLRNSCQQIPKQYPSKDISNLRSVSESRPTTVYERQPIYLGSYCDIYIADVIGDLRSPGFPYGYANNHSCVYSIRRYTKKATKKLFIKFYNFYIELRVIYAKFNWLYISWISARMAGDVIPIMSNCPIGRVCAEKFPFRRDCIIFRVWAITL